MGLGFSQKGNIDQSTMYLLNELSTLKRSLGSLDSVDANLVNVADRLTKEIDNFKKQAKEELGRIRETSEAMEQKMEGSISKSMELIDDRTKFFTDIEKKLEGVRGKFEDSLKSGDRVFKFIKEEYENLSNNISKLSKDLSKASGGFDSSKFDDLAEKIGQQTSEIFTQGVFKEQFTQNLLNDVQQILGETMPLILEEEVGKALEKLSKAPEVVEAAEKVDVASIELKDLSNNLYNYLQTLTQEVKSLASFSQQTGAGDLKQELAGFLNSMQDQLETIKNYETTITQVLREQLPKVAAAGGAGISDQSLKSLSQTVAAKVDESTTDLKNTAIKMHDVFSKFNDQMARMVKFLEALKSKEEELKQREARIAEYERRMQ